MKKQINRTIKAHLIRGAFYLLLLVAVCAIPFALAQRNTIKQVNPATQSKMGTKFAGAVPASGVAQATKLSGVHRKPASPGSRFSSSDVPPNVFADRILKQVPSRPAGGVCTNYIFTSGTDTIVPGDTNTGNNTDDGDTFVALPFSFSLYDQTFNGVNVSSNGRLDFVCINEPGGFLSACLPAPPNICPFDYTIFAPWSDYRTDIVGEGCSNFASGCGIFTSVSGSAPNRIFNIEWRVVYFADHNMTANFEARLYENDPDQRFDIVFGTIQPGSDQLYVSGVQGPNNAFTQDFCDGPPAAGSRTYICGEGGGTPTPTPTPGTPTPTPTATPTCPSGAPGGPAAWASASPYPKNIVRYGFAQTATHLYVFGGVSDGTRVNAANRLDLATGMWQSLAPMPFTSEAPTCALMEATGLVYCAEGDTGNGFASYDTATDTWTPLAADPFVTDHYGSASGAFNGKVFVVAGTTAFSNAIWIYDVAGNSWSVGTSAPTGPFLLAGYQQVGQFLYVVGGFDPSAVNLTTTSRLDMSSAPGVWEAGPTFAPQLADFGLAYDAGTNKLYSLGGDLGNDGNFFNSTNQVNELDLSAWPGGTWSSSPPDLPAPNRQANQAGFYGNGDIWSVGGLNGATFQFLPDVYHRNNAGGCPSPTPTATATTTPTATATPTASGSPTATATPTATAAPRSTPTPRPRPTGPPPRP